MVENGCVSDGIIFFRYETMANFVGCNDYFSCHLFHIQVPSVLRAVFSSHNDTVEFTRDGTTLPSLALNDYYSSRRTLLHY